MNSKQLGLYLKKRREFLKLTQGDLSTKMGFKTCQFISNIERGVADVPAPRIADYAQALELDPRELSRMTADTVKNKMMNKANMRLSGEDVLGKDDPFLMQFISAWNSASDEDKNNVKIIVSKFLNIK